jgi:membrane protease YdiL (CAAX protease family)
MRWWHYFIILGGFYIAAATVGSIFPEQDNEMIRLLQSSRSAVYIIAFLATFSAPLVEEVVYRGLLFSAVRRRAGGLWAVAIVTLLFAGVHYFQYWGSPGTIILITLLSLGLTLVRYKTKNLLPCIILHTLINGLQSMFLVLQPYLPQPEEVVPGIVHYLK